MERTITGATPIPANAVPLVYRETLDARSALFAAAASTGFFLLGVLCLSVSRFDAALASVWLPNACAVALLLLARLRNEIPIYFGMAIASVLANWLSGTPITGALIFSVANIVDIALVTWFTRKAGEATPDMTDLNHLVQFLLYGGLIGPVASAMIAALAMPASAVTMIAGFSSWFLADSMGMILIVPAVLLIADAIRNRQRLQPSDMVERSALMIGGVITVYVVFRQDTYPLLFLVPPVTLLVAFRLGGLGTALYVPGVAVVASWMTYSGVGPIVNNATSDISKMFVIQAFIAANFLTGLPIAAILAWRDKMTMELADGRRELSLLAENVTDAVLRIDNHGTCTYASPSVAVVMGRDPGELVGKAFTQPLSGDASDDILEAVMRLQSGESEQERITYRRELDAADGAPVFVEADCAIAIDPVTHRRSGVVISARDVTERVELELLLTRARRHAENAANAKSEFLANMSHEIRTPMNGVLGFAELMLQDDLSDEVRRHTEMIVQSGRSMMLLLNDILDLSKIEAGQIAIHETSVDIYSTLNECTALHRPTAEKKGLRLAFEAPCAGATGCAGDCHACDSDALHLWIKTDALRLRQIILNLIGNAVKFTETGEVAVTCALRDDQCIISVSDTGIGISRSRIDTIFDPFTQAESDTARRFGGTGLGLAISGQLAELLGGRIEVESEPGLGSTFRLVLPATLSEPEPDERAREASDQPVPLPQSASVLLVEDHDVNRMLGVEMLERCGQSVAVAHDGNEAIAMVMDSVMRGTPYDLVLMDIQMPGCDGYAATRAIRGEGIDPATMPIIALTANAFPEDITDARDAGMQGHLAKPLVFADLARALQRWLPTRIVEAAAASVDEADASEQPPLRADAVPDPLPAPGYPRRHTPALLKRWAKRREEAMEAVREALENGALVAPNGDGEIERLARTIHKLAGTAAIFGEPELGDQAAALERALTHDLPAEVREGLALQLLGLADEADGRAALTGG